MRILHGDILNMGDVDAICVTTNGIRRKDGTAVMGAGIARAAALRYPGLERELGNLLEADGNRVHLLHRGGDEPWASEPRDIVSFPTKEHWRDPSTMDLVGRSACELVALADLRGWTRVALPQPGCGLGGLDWETQVGPLLEDLLDDRFLVSSGL